MPRSISWEQHLGSRLRLRDLFVFFTVVEAGSMAKAGAKLGVSTPWVSEVIATLEHAIGARLLDRSAKGVVATRYGEVLMLRGRAAFDELRQGMRDIEFIGDPHAGELRISCPESITAGFLLPVLQRLTKTHPRVRYNVQQVQQPTVEYPELRERKVDLILARWGEIPAKDDLDPELDVQVLFDDPYLLVVGKDSEWARRRNVDLADLVDAPLIVPPVDAWGGALVADAFRRRKLNVPNFIISTLSISLRNELVASGRFVTLLTSSVVQTFGKRYGLKVLPIGLPAHQSPIGIVTLKNRTLGPAAQVFIQCARDVAELCAAELKKRAKGRAFLSSARPA